MNLRIVVCAVLLASAWSVRLHAASTQGYSHGGGWTRSGVRGDYFSNPNLSGEPAFSRFDVRIDFDWNTMPPGGSNSPGFRDVKADNYSVRWRGQVVPRHSEDYVFTTTSDDGVRLIANGKRVIDNWKAHTKIDNRARVPMKAGQKVDLVLEYREDAGPAVCRLAWESPSTPREIIDVAHPTQTNLDEANDYSLQLQFADAFKSARPFERVDNKSAVVRGADGWPTHDFKTYVWAGIENMHGTYALSFSGRAEVSAPFGGVTMSPLSYDEARNRTSGTFTFNDAKNPNLMLVFTNTRRTATSEPNTGVSSVRVMRPLAPGGSQPQREGELWNAAFKNMTSYYSLLRMMGGFGASGGDTSNGNWKTRRLPEAPLQSPHSEGQTLGTAIELLIQLCNETGKDFYVNVPFSATDEYVRNLALMLRFGSDGVNPYSQPTANPKYPPLNPNLRIYVEWSNEVWNWGHYGAEENIAEVKAELARGNSNLNFDGESNEYYLSHRRTARRNLEISRLFREVWGDASMPGTSANPRVRPLFMWQLGNGSGSGTNGLNFLHRFYNNGDGTKHVQDPRPLSYHFWGVGAATYYGSNAKDAKATTEEIFAKGIPDDDYRNRLRDDVPLAALYGVPFVVYEGGVSLASGGTPDALGGTVSTEATQARFDPRAKTAHLEAERLFSEMGGDINSDLSPVFFGNQAWTMSTSLFDLNTPIWQAHKLKIDTLPVLPTGGIAVAGTTTFDANDAPPQVVREPWADGSKKPVFAPQANSGGNNGFRGFMVNVQTPGTYRVSAMVRQDGAGAQMRAFVNGQLLGKTADVPQAAQPFADSLVEFGTVTLSKGQHGLSLLPMKNATGGAQFAGELKTVTLTLLPSQPAPTR